jgi:hypothetical protein
MRRPNMNANRIRRSSIIFQKEEKRQKAEGLLRGLEGAVHGMENSNKSFALFSAWSLGV